MTGNAALWFVDRHQQEGRSEKIAFREAAGAKRSITYGELASTSANLAGSLARAGIHPEDRVAMFVLDQIEFPVIFWGALKAGVVPVPVNTLLATDIYASILKDSGATAAFISAELLPVVQPAIQASPGLTTVVVIGDQGDKPLAAEGAISYAEFIADADPQETRHCDAEQVAFWLYSSGSTGQPKGVRHRHRALKVTCDTYGSTVLQTQESDVIYSAAKLFFAYGLGNGMSFPMAVGATAVLFNGRPTPDSVTQILKTENPTVFCGVPTLYAALLHQWEEHGNRPDTPLRTCISAGEALPADIGSKWKSLWGVDILDGVGSTEMLHIFLSNKPGDVNYGTSGTAVNGYAVRLVDENDTDLSRGSNQVGELLVKGLSSPVDYWNQPEKSKATFKDDWTRTGDKYEHAEDGRYIYCGRKDDMFKVSGIWVSPFEVEQAIASYPEVLEAAVVAARDGEGLEKPKAFVVLKSVTDEAKITDAIKNHVKERIGKWKYPRWIEIVSELPKTATGKIQRFKLRDQ